MIYYYSPRFNFGSNGIRIGYYIVQRLGDLGIEARILCSEEPQENAKIPPEFAVLTIYLCQSAVEILDDDIVIYTDVVSGNPLGAKKVVRYLMNRPYYLSGIAIEYGSTDYLTSYSNLVDTELPQLFVMANDISLIDKCRESRRKKSATVYFGKIDPKTLMLKLNLLHSVRRKFSHLHVVTRLEPRDREVLLHKVAESQLLISFDPISNLNYEATLVGTPVFLVDDIFNTVKGNFNITLYGFFTEMDQFKNAKEETKFAYNQYKNYLARQDKMILEWVALITDHFRKIEANPFGEYAKMVARHNKKQFEQDASRFSVHLNNSSLVNINYIIDLPESVWDVTGIALRMKVKKAQQETELLARKILRSVGLFNIAKRFYKRITHFAK